MAEAAARIETVTTRGLAKRYGRQRALVGLDLTLSAGRVCALLGPNGAGKSTLLGMLSTLVRPSDGTIEYRTSGGAVAPGAPLRRRLGVLAHESFVYGALTARENLSFFAKLYEVADAAARAEALLDEVGLELEARTRPAATYSRGMAQRLALARTLLHDPEVLFLDEPFTGLDRAGAAALGRTLAAARSRRALVLVVSHDFEALAGITDHVVVLRRGKAVFDEVREGGYGHAELKDVYHRFTE